MTHPDCHDDPSLTDEQLLLRRIFNKTIVDGRITSAAFAPLDKDTDKLHCSVDINSIRPPEDLLGSLFSDQFKYKDRQKKAEKRIDQGHKVAAIRVGTARKHGQKVVPQPCKEIFKDEIHINEAHANICGEKGDELLQEFAEEANNNIILGK